MKYSISNTSISVLLLLCSLISACEPQNKNPTESNKAQVQTTSSQSNPPPNTALTAADTANLVRTMGGGAAGIMPDDALKDKYGKPYIIGNLGGVPVNLPPTVVEYVEYNDSPGFDHEALRNFKPSIRNYDSVLESFGFEFRNRDLQLYDRLHESLYYARKKDRERNTFDWIDVGISSGNSYGKNPEALSASLNRHLGNVDYEVNPWKWFRSVCCNGNQS